MQKTLYTAATMLLAASMCRVTWPNYATVFTTSFQLDEMVDRLLHDALHTLPIPQRLLKLAEVRG
jgi:hypothetical protein